METFVICAIIVLSFGFVFWEVKSIGDRICTTIEEVMKDMDIEGLDEGELDEVAQAIAAGESSGVPMIIGVVRRNAEIKHPTIRCDICNNSQCLTCNGRACVGCGMEIKGEPVET